MKVINYLLGRTGIKLSKEPIYYEIDKEIKLVFDIPLRYRRYKTVAELIDASGKHHHINLIDQCIRLPKNLVYPGTIELLIKVDKEKEIVKIECEPLVIESLEKLKEKLEKALPDYANLPLQVKKLEARIEAQEKRLQKLEQETKEKQFIKQDIVI